MSISDTTRQTRRVLILSKDVIGPAVAGPGVRYLEMACRLARNHQVTLLVPNDPSLCNIPDVTVEHCSRRVIGRLIGRNDLVISQGFAYSTRHVVSHPTVQIFDLYAPLPLELLKLADGMERSSREARETAFYRKFVERRIKLLMRHGDFFLCASERQRDFWLGALAAAGRIDTDNFRQDHDLRTLIDCVPFGTPDEPFEDVSARSKGTPAARGVIPGIGKDDFLFLWGGGIWPWLDPETAIRAVAAAAASRPDIKLLFLGTGHPNPGVAAGGTPADRALALARELDVLDRNVFFNTGWTPYDARVRYLAEADAGLLAHHPGIETRFAFRTRLLDCFWAGIPVVATGGDELSELAAAQGGGLVVGAGDPKALAGAILFLAGDPSLRERLAGGSARLGEQYRWNRVFEPLERFVGNGPPDLHGGINRSQPRRMDAVRFGLWTALQGMRHGLWRRAWGKLFPGRRPEYRVGTKDGDIEPGNQ